MASYSGLLDNHARASIGPNDSHEVAAHANRQGLEGILCFYPIVNKSWCRKKGKRPQYFSSTAEGSSFWSPRIRLRVFCVA